jgi:membrane protein YqaA with SNARE-associated domain
MEDGLMAGLTALLHTLAIPEVGLGAVFVIAFVSATLLPLGSEPAVFGLVKLQPELFWPAIGVATLGNTLGGAVTWWMGRGARLAADKLQHQSGPGSQGDSPPPPAAAPAGAQGRAHQRAMLWLQRHGARACLLSWLPVVGDPLCAVAGWLRLPFWPCLIYMALGKLLRYVCMTTLLVSVS